MSSWLLFVLLSLTVYRVTRLVVRDEFPPIRWVRTRLAGDDARGVPARSWSPEWLRDLVSCQWCASGWVALGATLVLDAQTAGLPSTLLWWFASWGLGAALLNYEDRPEPPDVGLVRSQQDWLMTELRRRDDENVALRRQLQQEVT